MNAVNYIKCWLLTNSFKTCLIGEDGHHHHRKIVICYVMLADDMGRTSGNTPVNSLTAACFVEVSKSYLIYGMSSAINNIHFTIHFIFKMIELT